MGKGLPMSNHGLVYQALAKHQPLVGPLEALLDNGAHRPHRRRAHHPALVVEVGQNHVQTLVLLAQQVLHGHLDIVKGDVRGAGRGGVARLDGLGLDALAAGDEEHRQLVARADAGDKVVGPAAVGDPLLGAVDNVVLAIRRLDGRGADAGNVGARKGLGDGEAQLLLAGKDLIGDLPLPRLVVGKVEHAGQANGHARHVAVLEAALHGARELLADDEVVKVVKLVALHDAAEEAHALHVLARAEAHVQHALLGHAVNHGLGNVAARGLALLGLGDEVAVGEVAGGALEGAVGVVVVGRVEGGREPERLGVGDLAQVAGLGHNDLGRLAGDGANGQVGVLGEDLLAVEVVKGRGGVLAGDLLQDGLAAGMGHDEVGEVIDDAVDDAPEGVFGGVLAHLFAGKRLGWGGHCVWRWKWEWEGRWERDEADGLGGWTSCRVCSFQSQKENNVRKSVQKTIKWIQCKDKK